jgi:hypothetical protein
VARSKIEDGHRPRKGAKPSKSSRRQGGTRYRLRQQLAARACLRSPSRSLPAASRSGTIRRLIDDPHSAKEPCRTGSLRQGSSPSIHDYVNQGHGARFSSIQSRSALCTQVHWPMFAPLIHKLAATDRRRNINNSHFLRGPLRKSALQAVQKIKKGSMAHTRRAIKLERNSHGGQYENDGCNLALTILMPTLAQAHSCRELRRACEMKEELGETGQGNCRRYREMCGGGGGGIRESCPGAPVHQWSRRNFSSPRKIYGAGSTSGSLLPKRAARTVTWRSGA